jgi:hypothetical protein
MTEPDKEDPLSRAQELESIVDELDEKVAGEREAEGVPGKPATGKTLLPCLGERAARLRGRCSRWIDHPCQFGRRRKDAAVHGALHLNSRGHLRSPRPVTVP